MHGLRPPESRVMRRRSSSTRSERLVGAIASQIGVLGTRAPLTGLVSTPPLHGSLEASVCVRSPLQGRVIVLRSLLKDKPFYLR